ncbi:piggyBac transposable element-derived protein 4 isoform X1 [Diachasma alloeum]|uniref:piggyBac transposable element-derived protein 4 isoform X1 n=1 Tax=Diachasma alloeum TaxID=454923 RepID=UPI00073846F0|nr:piggyBac transposable element-derived protein 4 isoform X1 [Diachasma alloeum]XP_015120086.1 piggyBac transposable element-derived protein 4 isoform X1 [Diachasma alloeum]
MPRKPHSGINLEWAEPEDGDRCDEEIMAQEEDGEDEDSELVQPRPSTPTDNESDQSDCDISKVESSEENDNDRSKSSKSTHRTQYVFSKNKSTKWTLSPPAQVKKKRHNQVSRLPAVKNTAKDSLTPLECWELFFPEDTIDKMVYHTNLYLNRIRGAFERETDARATDAIEMRALLGILYMLGVQKAGHLNLKEIWVTDGTAPDFFRAVMSLKRFYQLLSALRFDDLSTRKERIEVDRLAPIREFFEEFNEKCQSHYTPGQSVVIDEMSESFKGRCNFRQYMPTKASKYGLKIYALVDAQMFYTVKMEVYVGKQPEGPYKLPSTSQSLVERLALPVLNSGRNITTSQSFTSLASTLSLLRNYRTTLVGTIKKNNADVPPELTAVQKRPVSSSLFCFTDECTLVSYVPKKSRNVLLLSSLHHDDKIDEETGSRQKPEIMTFYNATKGGVDVVDELKGNYSVNRETRRWPMVVFYGLMNIAGINSQIIYRENTGAKITRRAYLSDLAKSLVLPQLNRRFTIRTLGPELRGVIRKVAQIPNEVLEFDDGQTQGYCPYCPRRANKRSKKRCHICHKFICPSHTSYTCGACEQSRFTEEEKIKEEVEDLYV